MKKFVICSIAALSLCVLSIGASARVNNGGGIIGATENVVDGVLNGAENIIVSEFEQAWNSGSDDRNTNRYKSLQDWKNEIENSKTALSNNKDDKEPVKDNSNRKGDRED